MAINIKDLETEQLARKASALSGSGITQTIRKALQEFLRSRSSQSSDAKFKEIMAIARHSAGRKILDPRSPDEILGYDESGLPK